MSNDSTELSRMEDILSGEDYKPSKPMSRIEDLLLDGAMVPKVDSGDNGKVLKVIDGEWKPGEDISGDKLPPVSSADNGKVLKVVDAEWNIGTDEGDRLPFVTSADEGKVLKVDDQGHWEPEEEDPELPATTSADEGKILKVDSNGDWSKGDETVELPSVSSSDNGKILKVTEGSWAKGDAPTELPATTSADKDKVLKVNSNGNWEKATDTAADTVSQMNTAQDKNLPILFSYTQEVATKTEEAAINKDLKYNPGLRALTLGNRANGSTIGTDSVSLGTANTATNDHSYAEGYQVTASGSKSHAEGAGSTASGDVSHAEGSSTVASGDVSHAEGGANTASGDYSHAEGGSTTASGLTSHAEGSQVTASGDVSHAEGNNTTASGDYSHAEGFKTTASGITSHAEGSLAVASGNISHAEGLHTIAQRKSQHVFGAYNILDTAGADGSVKGNYIEIVGNGIADNDRSNARTLDWNGNETLSGKLTVGAGPENDMDVATKQYVDAHSGLPEVTVADEGKILEVNSSGEWDKGDAPESIQVGNATGDIVSFNDGADNILMPKLMVDIQPKQDLHGYDSPWVGGAGKNKMPLSFTDGSQTNGITIHKNNDGTIKITGKATAQAVITIGEYATPIDQSIKYSGAVGGSVSTYSVNIAVNGGYNYSDVYDGDSQAVNVSANDVIREVVVVRSGYECPTSGIIFYPMVRNSAESSTFAPYSNECPISGWTACNVVRSGANNWDEETQNGYWNTANGAYASVSGQLCCKNYISVKPSTTYYFHKGSTTNQSEILMYDKDKNYISYLNTNQCVNKSFETPSNCYFITFNLGLFYGTTYLEDISINLPNTDHDYHAYSGNTYTINFVDGSSPLTVYSGKLNVLSGLLTVDRRRRDLGDFTYTYDSTYHRFRSSNIYNLKVAPVRTLYMESSCYQCMWHDEEFVNIPDASFYNVNDGTIWVHDSRYTSGTDLKTALTGQSIVFPMETPQTYQLTPTQVKSLLEKNVIYADAGKVTVTYYKHSEALEDMDILFSKLPNVNTTDNNKALLVKNGEWTKANLPEVEDLYVPVTQAQYDTLPSSKYTDGILYFITDGEIEGLIPTVLTEVQYDLLTPEQKADRTKLYFIGDKYIYYRGVRYDGPEASVNAIKQGLNDNGISLQYYKDSEIVGSGSFVTPYPIGVFAGGEPQISSVYGGDPDFQWVGYGTQLQYILNYNHGLEKPLPPGYELIDYVKPSEVWWLNYAETALSSMGSETQPTNPGSYHDIHHWAGFYFRVTHDFNKEGPLLFKLGDRVEAYADVINGDFYLSVRINYGDSWGTGLIKLVEDYVPAIGKECRILLKVISGSFYCEFDCEEDNISSGSKSITTYGDISSSAIGISNHLTVTALYIYRSTEGSTSAMKHFIAKHIDDNDHTVYSLLADNDSSWDMEPYSLYDYSSFDYAHFTLGSVVEQADIETYINAKRFRTRNPQKLYGEDELWMKVPNLPAALPADNGKSIKVNGGKWVKDYILHDEDDVIVGKDSWNEDIVQRVIEISDYDHPNGITSTDGLIHLFTVNTRNKEVINCEIVRAAGLHTDINNVLTMSDPSKDPRVGLVVVAKWIDSSHLGFYALVTQTDVTVHPTLTDPADRNIHYGEIVVQYSLRTPFFV